MKQAEGLHEERSRMVEYQLRARGILNSQVLAVFGKVPREEFVPEEHQGQAYEDHPISIGPEQTISQPYIVALMTECLALTPEDRVLEVGTGSGYQTAILAELSLKVYTIEIVDSLYSGAQSRLKKLGYRNIYFKLGDGREGWPEEAPFDKIIVTAGARDIPEPLVVQLKEGGQITIPLGDSDSQDLVLGRKEKGILRIKQLIPVRFVSLQ